METIEFGDMLPSLAETQNIKVQVKSEEMEIEDSNTEPVFKRPAPDIDIDPEIKGKIKDNYNPEARKDTKMQKCPRCEKLIPLNEYEKHLKSEFMDNKSREKAKARDVNPFVSNEDMNKNIQAFAEKRTDLFGTSKEEASAPQNDSSKVVYDGHVTGMTRTTANAAMLAQQQKKNIDTAFRARDDYKHKTQSGPPNVEAPAFKPLLNIKQSIYII